MAVDEAVPTALVTGAASGIGYAVAQRFGQEGARLVLVDVDHRRGPLAAEILRAAGCDVAFMHADVRDERAIEGVIDRVRKRFGGLDWACHSAGIGGGGFRIADASRTHWEDVLTVNLTAVWLCLKHEIPVMRRGGSIVNVASVAGLVGLAGSSAYVAAKHGVIGLTKTAAIECAPERIRVNAVCPGAIDTPLLRRRFYVEPERERRLLDRQLFHRLGTADEVADAVTWLCTGARFVTGQALSVDGGWTAQ
jgi:NAD(P)-dependent dehydrogenase (short-subunit alcohol dehydrogenase family)